jgi:DNA uptake protein ComE-like DNA-binding protein
MPVFVDVGETDYTEFKKEITIFRQQRSIYQDSVGIKKKQNRGGLSKEDAAKILKPFNFDPNTLDENGWLKMGFTSRQFQSIENYLSKGGKFRKPKDLNKMYCISEVEFAIVEPFIVIEEPIEKAAVSRKSKNKTRSNKTTSLKETSKPKVEYTTTELNSADSAKLVGNLKLYPSNASRVIKYKNELGGFYKKEQLLEVYNFPEGYYRKIEVFIEVDSSLVNRINVNSISFKKLLKHPYFNYETTKLIFNNKPKKGKMYYSGFQELKELTGINDSIAERIKHYLYFGSPK